LDLPYESGKRTGMQKIKSKRTADCVVGGFRYLEKNDLSVHCCWACTTTAVFSITSVIHHRCAIKTARRSPRNLSG
jgi:ATP-dependent DNA ligase